MLRWDYIISLPGAAEAAEYLSPDNILYVCHVLKSLTEAKRNFLICVIG